jgi:hypothetical protein
MKKVIILLITMTACAELTDPNFAEDDLTFTGAETNYPVSVDVTQEDSTYSMTIHNRIDGLSLEDVKANYTELITRQTDEGNRKHLIELHDLHTGVSYVQTQNEKIINRFNGRWVFKQDEETLDTIEITQGLVGKFPIQLATPNLLMVPYDSTYINFTLTGKGITGIYKDQITAMQRLE